MDPNEARALLNRLLGSTDSGEPTLDDASEAWQALDQWLCSGGFLPSEWER